LADPASAKGRHKGGLTDEEVISEEALRSQLLEKKLLLLLDSRSKRSFDAAHIEGASLPLADDYYRQEDLFASGLIPKMPDRALALKNAMQKHPKDIPIVTYCSDDCQSGAVLLYDIKKLGFQNVRMLETGFQSWEGKGYPVTTNEKPVGSDRP